MVHVKSYIYFRNSYLINKQNDELNKDLLISLNKKIRKTNTLNPISNINII